MSAPAKDGDPLEHAVRWRLRLEGDSGLAEGPEFQQWFTDPQNKEAFARACATWDAFEDHLASPQLLAIRRDALNRAHRASRPSFRLSRRRAGMAAALLAALGMAVGGWLYLNPPGQYMAGVGERRLLALEDGSRISLDSDTALKVHYTDGSREILLLKGRAHFDVAHNAMRPFTVNAGNETVVAVGTSFDVERLGQKVFVTLIEGRVVVKSAAPSRPNAVADTPLTMTAGEQLIASPEARPAITTTNLSVATAWQSGRLIFNDEPLAQAVARINRYTDKPLTVDPAVAGLRINGVFNAGDVSAFVDAITSYFPVEANVGAGERTVLQKRS